MKDPNQETKFIPLSKAKTLIENIVFGRLRCYKCKSFDHECGCTPNVNERYRKEIIYRLIAIAKKI